jgi:Novel STAND NTPase 1
MSTVIPAASGTPVAPQYAKPYKGLDSFGVEDSAFFFGRNLESDQIIAKVLSSRLMLLHAQSGAGKTSLLNARVIPGLEARGATAVRTTARNDPVRQIQTASLLQLLPPPQAECAAIERAWDDLGAPETLGAMLLEFDHIRKTDPADPRCRSLVAPVDVVLSLPWEVHDVSLKTYPWFCRLLRSAVGMAEFAARLSVAESLDGETSPPAASFSLDTPVSELFDVLTADVARHGNLLPQLFSSDVRLTEFFQQIFAVRRESSLGSQLVVLFDQAEELFTRFVDRAGRAEGPDWRKKWELFEQLEELLGGSPDTAFSSIPVRFVVSLRSEYFVQLDGLRAAAWANSHSVYHLNLLTKDQAKAALREPARLFGYDYTDDCAQQLIDELAMEGRFVEPSHLQIVCEHLWAKKGQALAEVAHRFGSAGGMLGKDDLESPRDIVRSYFQTYLDTLVRADRLDTLEMLEQLVTRSGTRNILNREDLVRAPFRDQERRARLLAGLAERRLVREEGRLGGRFVEITHEFLVDFILDAVKELPADVEHARLRWALDSLSRTAEMVRVPRAAPPLAISQLLAINDNRAEIVQNWWLREVMLRSTLLALHQLPEYRRDEVLKVWVGALANDAPWEPTRDEALARIETDSTGLTIAELRAIFTEPGPTLSITQLRAVLRSELALATGAERDRIVHWTTELMNHEK